MSNPIYNYLPAESLESDALAELALNLRWSWHRSADELWGQLEPELWERTQNPWVVLQTVSLERLRAVSSEPDFRRRTEELLAEQRAFQQARGWFQKKHADSPLALAAYFSMEYMLSEALPIYSGGLGNVAGDQLKAASDLGVPVAGVGLLYQQGYFRQEIALDGSQVALYPYNEPGQLPIRPLREKNGEWLRLPLAMPGLKLWVRAWQVQVGRVSLYLLDSNDPANPPAYSGITSELYGGGPETRIKQEIILGIGGWRLLHALGLSPQVCHLNEGHAAFAVLERARAFMTQNNVPFDAALAATRAGNVFTTHTPVDAGFDRFAPQLMEKYLRHYAEHTLGIGFGELMALGRLNPNDASEPFNMAYLALHGSGAVNGVSRLHGEVSRRLFAPLFPHRPETEVPIGYVTNGIHVPTWESPHASEFWDKACGEERWRGDMDRAECDLRQASDSELWHCRTRTSKALVTYVRRRLGRQRAEQGAAVHEIAEAERLFDPDALTLGFARRFATYKRPNLLLSDPARLLRILSDPHRPVQLVLAGKAHPEDQAGQAMIRQWNEFIVHSGASHRIAFIADYDMLLTQQLVQGVDVWINSPRRPWEASGTSGMKTLANGGLNLSELDGWWAEAYSPEVGWAIGDGREHGADPAWDAAEAAHLYSLLEQEVIPDFYNRDGQGVPRAWVARMRESMARLTPRYSADRVVREYLESYYLPAAAAYLSRAASGGRLGAELAAWRREIAAHWPALRFGEVQVKSGASGHEFRVPVYLDDLAPESIAVELYADPQDGPAFRQEMTRGDALIGSASGFCYAATAPAGRPATDYTPRIVPRHPAAIVPLEASEILWQK